VRLPAGPNSTEKRFGSCAEAILYLEDACPVRNKAREDCDAANAVRKAAEDKVGDAEAGVAETKKKLDNSMAAFSENEESLESANVKLLEVDKSLESASAHAERRHDGGIVQLSLKIQHRETCG